MNNTEDDTANILKYGKCMNCKTEVGQSLHTCPDWLLNPHDGSDSCNCCDKCISGCIDSNYNMQWYHQQVT